MTLDRVSCEAKNKTLDLSIERLIPGPDGQSADERRDDAVSQQS